MARFVSVFVSEQRQRLFTALIFGGVLCAMVGLLVGIGLQAAHDQMRASAEQALDAITRVRTHAERAFDILETTATAEPCSAAFQTQMRRVAFLPDGLNEFLFIPDGRLTCSTTHSRLSVPVDLGRPDLEAQGPGVPSEWVERPLDALGLDGLRGSILARRDFAVVVPPIRLEAPALSWYRLQAVITAPDGRIWHRSGAHGVYDRDPSGAWWSAVHSGDLLEQVCDATGRDCVSVEGDLAGLVTAHMGPIAAGLMIALLAAGWSSQQAGDALRRYWSFEARFRRHLNADSVVCSYQPIMETATGVIAGCEVLARWRDVDDRIVYPDQFIPIVEKHRLTLVFTDLVVRKAHRELTAALPPGARLQVNFNIFPCDLDAAMLLLLLQPFLADPDRFTVAVEIVESDALVPDHAERAIRALQAAGVKVYVDDFGSGYSTVETLVTLSVDGVKLDRSFAMAPDQTVMAKMMSYAIEMIHTSGRAIVVEGVETADRLEQLKAFPYPVGHVQGYHISRPVDVERLVAVLAASGRPRTEPSFLEAHASRRTSIRQTRPSGT